MAKKELFTTGEVIGLTRLKIASVQRYIKTYYEFFSYQARQPNRGRRFTGDDVKKLQLIKYLYSIRESKSEIIKSLRGEKEIPSVAWLEVTDALDIALSATKAAARSEEILAEMKRNSRFMKWYNGRLLQKFKVAVAQVQDVAEKDHKVLFDWIRIQKAKEQKRDDDFRYVLEGRMSNEQRRRAMKIHSEEMRSRTFEETDAAEIEWEKQKEQLDKVRAEYKKDDEQVTKKKGLLEALGDIANRIIEKNMQ